MWRGIFFFGVIFFGSLANTDKTFPKGFKWGAATSAYQIEGGFDADGKGLSAPDVVTGIFPSFFSNDTGKIACDSYHKWQEDIALLKELGVKTYRFSISWSRILPTGNANLVNQAGVDYYFNVIKALKENGIEPYVTLLHFDIPAVTTLVNMYVNKFEQREFASYARVCFKYFGKYVKYWFTVNEPHSLVITRASLFKGINIYEAAKSILMAHALAWRIYDKEFRAVQKGNISAVLNSEWFVPYNDSNLDNVNAANQDLQFTLGWFAEPIYFGRWPQVMIDRIGNQSKADGLNQSRLPEFTQEERDTIKGTHDFFAINHYGSYMVQPLDPSLSQNKSDYQRDKGTVRTSNASWTCPNLAVKPTEYWCAYPQGFKYLLSYINQTYSPKEIFVTENGWADNGGVQDTDRIAYLVDYLGVLWEAINEDHIPITTYQTWSLLDNFEWNFGYKIKFGLVSVDFNDENRTRTPKDSFKWYKKVVETNSLDVPYL